MKRIITGVKPTGTPTLGNYIGAIKNLKELSKDNELLVFVADLHAITVPIEKKELKNNIKNLIALYLACGLDNENTKIFIQSELPEHNQLGWVFECNTYVGELERMTQFKDKKQKQESAVSSGLLTYPPLMAADILLYDANYVPVGDDQKQHLEMTRNIAIRMNNKYNDLFVVPEGIYNKVGARIKSLTDASKKMSKSDNDKSYISLLDDVNIAIKKIKSAKTDSDSNIKYDLENKPEISNLLTIYSSLTNINIPDIEKKYTNLGYKEFKEDLANIVGNTLKEIQDKYNYYINSDILDKKLDEGYNFAKNIALKKIKKVYKKIGLGRNN